MKNKLMKNKLLYSLFLLSFFHFSAFAVDQCNNTAECKNKFGSTATDCKDSKSNTSICLCGNKACDTGAPSSVAVSSKPASVAASSKPSATIQCNNTTECKNKFGSPATDCKNSKTVNSVCMCGATACETGSPSSKPASSQAKSSTPMSSKPASSKAASSTPSTSTGFYTQIGTDKTWAQLISEKAIPIGVNSTNGITGSKINVNHSVVEVGPYANRAIPSAIRIHTVGNSVINRADFAKWSRWYQEDESTQVFRIFKGEYNVRNTRRPAARIESFSNNSFKGSWNEFTARYTLVDIRGCVGPHYCGVFQSKSPSDDWSVMIKIKDNGDVLVDHRTGTDKIALTNMNGKAFDLRVRDDGHNWEAYINGNQVGKGSYSRGTASTFRWGIYMGKSTPTQDIMILVSGAKP